MQAELEHIRNTPDLSWRYGVARASKFGFAWHFHPEFELTLITEGAGTRFVGDSIEPYVAGDLALLGPDLPHSYESSAAMNEAVVVQFRRDFLGPHLFASPELVSVDRLLTSSSRGLVFEPAPHEVVAQLPRLETLSRARRTVALLDVLVTLADGQQPRTLASAGYRPQRRDESRQRMDAVFRLLHSEYVRPLPIGEVAAVAHLSPGAFSRFFRRTTGRTLTAYLTELRVAAACRALMDTDQPIARIAAESGFGNLSNFNRRFRAIKEMSPRAYRSRFTSAR